MFLWDVWLRPCGPLVVIAGPRLSRRIRNGRRNRVLVVKVAVVAMATMTVVVLIGGGDGDDGVVCYVDDCR